MRNRVLWLASALMATLVLGGGVLAQPPRDRGGFPDRFGRPGGPGGGLERAVDDLKLSEGKRETALAAVRAYQDNGRTITNLAGADLLLKMKEIVSPEEFTKLKEAVDRARAGRRPTTDDVVERILSFDKNKDGKVTKEELPERMQDLIAKGDTNKDGALDREEIKKLAADLPREEPVGRGGPGGRGGRGGPGDGIPPRAVERAVDDLNLTGKTKESAAAAVKVHQENVRKLTELVRSDLLLKMSESLNEEEFKKFKTALDRDPGFGDRPGGRDGRPPFGPPGRFGPPRP